MFFFSLNVTWKAKIQLMTLESRTKNVCKGFKKKFTFSPASWSVCSGICFILLFHVHFQCIEVVLSYCWWKPNISWFCCFIITGNVYYEEFIGNECFVFFCYLQPKNTPGGRQLCCNEDANPCHDKQMCRVKLSQTKRVEKG